jgi:hypothetical protein
MVEVVTDFRKSALNLLLPAKPKTPGKCRSFLVREAISQS